ncbi:universal stress protein [Thalassotalea sp. SU-HH00458]|uniref:universal stress protein n=1 Tax=Thalassotalea sp. SU-HH00458 TaxID=3127657 RepID=UPI0031097754
MECINNILALAHSKNEGFPAIKKAIQLANISHANLKVLYFEKSPSYINKWLKKAEVAQNKEYILLHKLVESAHQQGINISCEKFNVGDKNKILHSFFNQNNCDLVVCEYQNKDESLWSFDGHENSNLLYASNIPTMFVKNKTWHNKGQILAAIETEEETLVHQRLNREIVDSTCYVAHLLDGDIHLLNCYLESCLMSFPTIDVQPEKSKFSSHSEHLTLLAEKHHLNKDNLHIEQGLVDDLLPQQASKMDADIVVLGCGEHKGILSMIQGHTIDFVLGKLDCDLLALKPGVIH